MGRRDRQSLKAGMGRAIRELREQKRLQQQELAERLGRPPGTVSAWETGKAFPEGENLMLVAEILGTTGAALMDLAKSHALPQPPRAKPQDLGPEIPVYRLSAIAIHHGRPRRTVVKNTVPRSTTNDDPHAWAVRIEGNDFYPYVWSGDVLELQTNRKPQSGAICFVVTRRDRRKILCRLRSLPNKGWFRMDPVNPAQESEEFKADEIDIFWVVGLRRPGMP